jgi:hypothetical protein
MCTSAHKLQQARIREDQMLTEMSASQQKEIERSLLSMTLLDALFHYPQGPRRRLLEKLICGDDYIDSWSALLKRTGLSEQRCTGMQTRVQRMKVATILRHSDQRIRIVANYLAATSV